MSEPSVTVVGAGPAGLTAAIYTARAGLDTRVVHDESSILTRNAHLENVPGFPAGVSARRFLDLTRQQARRNGCSIHEASVTGVETAGDGFRVETDSDSSESDAVVCASWAETAYLDGLGVETTTRGSKTYIEVDDGGRTGVEGVYAAGRIAGQAHQTVVVAGHGATVGLAVIEDSEVPFYHDWVAPEGYFTDRGRPVPPGCEEIDDEQRRRRERETLELMQETFTTRYPEGPTQHPSVREE